MAVNPFFKDYIGEQRLLDDLTVETIKAMGRDLIYIPREYLKVDGVFGEDPKSYFSNGYIIEMYVRETLKFGGNKDIITKFGIAITDRLTIDLARTRFKQEVTTKQPELVRPREGDLIWYPLSNSIFEINYVEDEEPFYQFGSLTTYTLTCELFTYSYEKFDTGFSEIDAVEEERNKYAVLLGLTGSNITGITLYKGGETVYQGTTLNQLASATLVDQTITNGIPQELYVTNITGSFTPNLVIYGFGTNAGYTMTTEETTIVNIPHDPFTKKPSNNNDDIEKEASFTIEFSADNPFSEGC